MNISRPSICKWNKVRRFSLLATTFCLTLTPVTPAQTESLPPRPLLPFLEEFKAPLTTILTKEVTILTAAGKLEGQLARPDVAEALPALLLIHEGAYLGKWMKQNVRDLAGLGYVVLAVNVRKQEAHLPVAKARELTQVELSAAVPWLRRRPDVLPSRIGVVGWSWGAEQALTLAASSRLQACVVCGGAVAADPATIEKLRGTPILGIFGGKNSDRAMQVGSFRSALTRAKVPNQIRLYEGAEDGFMNPENAKTYAHGPAEEAWVEIYEFLGKYVEDAPAAPPGR